ncbi:MAG TPA: DUF885 domain-containing protein [Vicinamibacteria bacterium]|nr:DUF885 domain-containing protein [Vicinamibacteria bacterium]
MKTTCRGGTLTSLALAAALGAPGERAAWAAPPDPAATAALHALIAEDWEVHLREDPLLATAVGDRRYDDRLPSMTRADLDRRAAHVRAMLERVRAVDPARLGAADRVSRVMFEREKEEDLALHEFGAWQAPLNADSGFHTQLAQLPSRLSLSDTADYDRYIARLRAMPTYVGQQIALMREGLRSGFTVPRVVLGGPEATVRAHVVSVPEKSVFWAPFAAFPPGVPEGERERLRREGRAAVMEGAVASYRAFLDFLAGEYQPGARTTTSAASLPRGPEYYAHLVRRFTTLDVTPEEVHEIGRAEVERIGSEMAAVMRRTGFEGDLQAFFAMLRTDPRFQPESAEDLLQRASFIAKKMDGRLPSLFSRLPRMPYGVEPVPEEMAPRYTAGRYVPAPVGGSQGGTYWVNTYALKSRTLFTLEALTLHEAVPGHHLQIALQRELEGLPPFRRHAGVGAFVEGWALYAERLGLEAGFYQDPYSDFGRLTYEMWRACRLVVDTGLHAQGWTRDQAIDYLARHTALSRHEIETETDRYISWPGQALGYKMGELKIRELRKEAEAALGPAFDVRAFHDAVLAQGAIPLAVLESEVRSWLAARVAAPAGRASASAPDH